MKKIATSLIALALCAVVAAPAFSANAVRISQVYSGGGGSTGTYINDFVELFNSTGTAINIGGWVVEYGSATGNWGSATTNYFTIPAGTFIGPCSYILIQCGASGSAGVPLPVAANFVTTNMSMSATAGKVALFNALNAGVACGAEAAGTLVDKVSWGTANCPEGTNVAAFPSTSSAVRNLGGMTDTDNNLADFSIDPAPVPRNSSSVNPNCLVTPATPKTWGMIKTIYR